MGFFDRFKKTPPLTPAVQFAENVVGALRWWLLLLVDNSGSFARSSQFLNAALNWHDEGWTVADATCELARSICGNVIYNKSAEIRTELLEFLNESGWDIITNTKVSASLVELSNGVNKLLDDEQLRATMRRQIVLAQGHESLSPEANEIYVGITHLAHRALVALGNEGASKEKKSQRVMMLLWECNYALNGNDDASRERMHVERESSDIENGEPMASEGEENQ